MFILRQVLMATCGNIYGHACVHTDTSLPCELTGLEEMAAPRCSFLIPFSSRRSKFPGDMADSKVGAGNLQDDRGASQSPESKEVFKTQNHNNESCRSQLKELPQAEARTTGAENRIM